MALSLSPALAQTLDDAASQRIDAETRAVLADLAAHDLDAVFDRFDAVALRQVPRAGFLELGRGLSLDPSAAAHSVTVYPKPELLVAVDFSGPSPKGGHVCGFVVWSGVAKGTMAIRRIEFSAVPDGRIAADQAEALSAVLQQLRCPPALIESLTGVTVN